MSVDWSSVDQEDTDQLVLFSSREVICLQYEHNAPIVAHQLGTSPVIVALIGWFREGRGEV